MENVAILIFLSVGSILVHYFSSRTLKYTDNSNIGRTTLYFTWGFYASLLVLVLLDYGGVITIPHTWKQLEEIWGNPKEYWSDPNKLSYLIVEFFTVIVAVSLIFKVSIRYKNFLSFFLRENPISKTISELYKKYVLTIICCYMDRFSLKFNKDFFILKCPKIQKCYYIFSEFFLRLKRKAPGNKNNKRLADEEFFEFYKQTGRVEKYCFFIVKKNSNVIGCGFYEGYKDRYLKLSCTNSILQEIKEMEEKNFHLGKQYSTYFIDDNGLVIKRIPFKDEWLSQVYPE